MSGDFLEKEVASEWGVKIPHSNFHPKKMKKITEKIALKLATRVLPRCCIVKKRTRVSGSPVSLFSRHPFALR